MGYRLHVANEYKVRYDSAGYFNRNLNKIAELIDECFESIYANADCIENADYIEIPKYKYLKGIDKMKEYLTNNLNYLQDYTNDEILEIFTNFYNIADEEDDCIHLSWF